MHQPPHGQGDHEDHPNATQIYSSVAKIPRAAPAVSEAIGSSETGVLCEDQETAWHIVSLDILNIFNGRLNRCTFECL